VSSDPLPIPESIRFGEDLELDRPAYQLRRTGRALKLERIPLDILFLLAERRGHLVTREEIAERIWGKGAHLDVDNSINGAVRKIRQVLEDDPEQPRFIQTVTGRGYRFVAPVLEPGGARPEPAPAAPAPVPRPSHRRPWLSAALVLPLLLAALVWSRDRSQAGRSGRVMLAVLPFQNLTGDENQEYLSDGLTEEMITQLGNRDPAGLG
jgi:DNA-binding winged helix-turn-helix (wHTH) protein